MKRLLWFGAAAALSALAAPSTTFAHSGPPVDVFTDVVKSSAVVPFEGPCGGGEGAALIEFHDKFHVTAFSDGHSVVSANQVGTFEFEPFDQNEPGVSGHYRNGFTSTFTQNSATNTSVFNVVGRDENGEQVRFQIRSHFTVANGEVRVDNFTVSCA